MAGADDVDVTFGLWLRRWRDALGLSRRTLSKTVGCSAAMIKQIESGENRPSAALAVRLAIALGAPTHAQGAIVEFARESNGKPLPLPDLATAMSAPTPVSGRVPPPQTPLLGRERELALVAGQLERPRTRLVTLTGIPGIGKTHLARTVALDIRHRFAQGAWFVELTGISESAQVARRIARGIGVADFGSRPIEDQLRIVLAERTMLLILDGVEPGPATEMVGGLLAETRYLKLLATSLVPLGLAQEVVVPVPPLATPQTSRATALDELANVPSVTLFVDRARAASDEFTLDETTAPAVTVISNRLGGHPLAVELAAARLGVVGLSELVASVHRADDVLGGRTLAAVSQPSRELQAALELAWNTLSDKQRHVLVQLAMFPEGCDFSAANAIAEATVDDLGALIAAGLLYRDADRLLLHDLVRTSAARRLKPPARNRFARRHTEHYLRLAEEAGPALASPAREPSVERLAADEINLHAAVAWSLEHAPTLALRLAAALSWYWYFSGEFGQGRIWLRRAADLEPSDELARARVLAGLGGLAWAQGNHAMAREALEEALAALRTSPTPTLVHALAILALTAHDQNDHATAVSYGQQATAAGRTEEDNWSLAFALTAEGAARFGARDLEGADAILTEALTMWADVGDSWGAAMALLNCARIAFARTAYAAATTYLEEALERLQHARDRRFSAAALLLWGEIARRQGDLGLALAQFAASLTAYEEVDAAWGTKLCLEGLAATCAAAGRLDQATQLVGAASSVRAPGAATRSTSDMQATDELVARLQEAQGVQLYKAHLTAGQLLTPRQAVATLA